MQTKKSNKLFFFIFFILLLISGGYYSYNLDMFEKNQPMIKLDDRIYWNLKSVLKAEIFDDVGIKNYKVVFNDGRTTTLLMNKTYEIPEKNSRKTS